MVHLSRRELFILVLIVLLVTAWAWDHIRTAEMLRRALESEAYFRGRLFERLQGNPDLEILEGASGSLLP